MVKIRLFRTGATKRPMYRIVAIDSRRQRQGRVLEILGTYQPRADGAVTLDEAALERWLGKGAQLSDTVRSLVKRYRKQAPAAEAEAEALAPTEEAAAAESAPAS